MNFGGFVYVMVGGWVWFEGWVWGFEVGLFWGGLFLVLGVWLV